MVSNTREAGKGLGTEATSATTDSQLVTDARAGDPRAFGQLVRRHAPIARRMAVLWGAGADADDVVQDAFVRAYAGLGGYPAARSAAEALALIARSARRSTRLEASWLSIQKRTTAQPR